MSFHLPRLDVDPASPFPPVDSALRRPDGLLAFGGDLSVPRLLLAYRHGIFPWFSEGQPIMWWSPDPRMVFHTDRIHLSQRFRRGLRSSAWTVHSDTAFRDVVDACAASPRPGQDGTWITAAMVDAYCALHAAGHAHSVEVRDGDRLVGGIYGVAVGRAFFGESMFSGTSGGSKVALAALAARLVQWGMPLVDAQVTHPHLERLGAERVPRERFMREIGLLVDGGGRIGAWTSAFGVLPAVALADVGAGAGISA